MKITTERLPKSLVALNVELEPQQVQKGLERAARKLSQQYRIPGFRPGKAPRQIVENYFGRDRLLEEATEDLIQKTFPEALKQEELAPVGRPTLESVEHEPFRYRVTVPVEPTISLPEYAAYRLPYEPEAVTDESVQKLLDAQREQHVVLKELDDPRPAQPGDMLTVTISSDLDEDEDDGPDDEDGELEGEQLAELEDEEDEDDEDEDDEDEDDADAAELDALEDDEEEDEDDEIEDESEATERQLPLVEGRVDPEFYEALIGAGAGDSVTVVKSYGEDEEDEELRGKTVTYTIDVKNVQERELPDWDELPTLSEFEGDFDALRENARNRLERASSDKARRELVDSFLGRLEAETSFDLPEAMIEERAHELFHQQVAEYQRYGLDEESYLKAVGKTHEEAVAEYAEQAERDVRRSMVLRELVQYENVRVSDSDISAEGERFTEDFPLERRDEVRRMLGQANMQQMLASAVLDRKLNDQIVALATGNADAMASSSVEAAEVDPSTLPQPVDEATALAPVVDSEASTSLPDRPEEPTALPYEPEVPVDEGPTVLPDVADGGVTRNDVFEDAGAEPAAGTDRESVEQAAVGGAEDLTSEGLPALPGRPEPEN